MSKIFLIHGSMVGVPSFYKSAEAINQQIEDGMYAIFREELKNQNPDYYLFKWMSAHDPKDRLNPKADLDSYYKEQSLVLTDQLQSRLAKDLEAHNPIVIVSHSMGCELLINTINNYSLPLSVKSIITVNSDSDQDQKILDTDVIARLKTKELKFINLHSITDITLMSSVILNKMVPRAGLKGYSSKLVDNRSIDIFGNHNLALTLPSVKKIILDQLI
jgi:predicted alpha/beta hydrolase family esterase